MLSDVSYLRELAHRCVRLAHNCSDQHISHELDAIGAELMEKTAEMPTGIAASPAVPTATITTLTPDPLLILLRRYERELAAFDNATSANQISERDWDRIAEETWSRTQDEILERQPPATTASGALLALAVC